MSLRANNYSISRLALHSAAAGLFLFLFGPLEVFIHNSEEFSSDPGEVLGFLSVIAIVASFVIFGLLALISRSFKDVLIRSTAFLVIGSWVLSNFLYGDYGRLDGTGLKIPAMSWLSVFQTVALLGALLLTIKLQIRNVYRVTGIVFLAGLGSAVIGLISLEWKDVSRAQTDFPKSFTEYSPTQNVLHVVLDQMGVDLFLLALEEDSGIREAFDGFTVFADTLSVYPSTQMSIVTLMTGEVYRNGGPKKAYVKNLRSRSLGIKRLESLGFQLDAHTKCRWGVVDQCTINNNKIVGRDIADIEVLQLLDIFMFKSVPDYVKPGIYNDERWLLLEKSGRNEYLKFQSGVAHLLFDKYVKAISLSESPVPRYKFFHSLVTHAPSDLDADCRVLSQDQTTNLSTPELILCGLGHFSSLLEKLKEIGVYDNTMIILSSDHGDYRIDDGVDIAAFERAGFEADQVTRSFASLAIKLPNARGPVAFSQAQVSLRDIPHTILAANGLNTESEAISGTRNVFSVQESETRERDYLFYRWKHEYWQEKHLPPITTIRVSGPMKNPAHWRVMSSPELSVDK